LLTLSEVLWLLPSSRVEDWPHARMTKPPTAWGTGRKTGGTTLHTLNNIQCLHTKMRNNYLESVQPVALVCYTSYHPVVTTSPWWRKYIRKAMLADGLSGIQQMSPLGVRLRGKMAARDRIGCTGSSVDKRPDYDQERVSTTSRQFIRRVDSAGMPALRAS
jgi:hypothetical protein